MNKFDLNIEKVLEDWETCDAIREVIANALDEQVLTQTAQIQIFEGETGSWHIKDFGRGLKSEHLTQKENDEKLQNQHLIGKFGVGLKDALATFDRRDVKVSIKSAHADITLGKYAKHDFHDITTLHAYVSQPSDNHFVGTEFFLDGCKAADVETAKNLFLLFSGERVLEKTKYGEVLEKKKATARIYINGVRVAQEENFLFSYNITSLTQTIKKTLNRERRNVGRTAYSDRIKQILLLCKERNVVEELIKDLEEYETGFIHDELKWTDVSNHAAKVLNALKKVVFFTPVQLANASDMVNRARDDGLQIVTVPENLRDKIRDQRDLSGNTIRDLEEFKREWNESFRFKFVDVKDLKPLEKMIFQKTDSILKLIGGKPAKVREIKISEGMRIESVGHKEATGIWQEDTGRVIIKRTQLRCLKDYAGTLLHEVAHAISGAPDVSSDFEECLSELLGIIASDVDFSVQKRGILSKLFGYR